MNTNQPIVENIYIDNPLSGIIEDYAVIHVSVRNGNVEFTDQAKGVEHRVTGYVITREPGYEPRITARVMIGVRTLDSDDVVDDYDRPIRLSSVPSVVRESVRREYFVL